MSFPLPAPLAGAIESMTAGSSHAAIAERAATVSAHYREGRASEVAIASPADVAAYVLARMPATFAAACAALSATRELMPSFSPASLLDLCAGPGTASFAALSLWPEISALTLVDAESFLPRRRAFARRGCGVSAMREAELIRSTLSGASDGLPSADLVVMSYALVELPPDEIAELARRIWSRSRVFCSSSSRTPEGFRRILLCRDALIARRAHLIAPCPHLEACPMQPPAWCHFSERLPRSRQHRLAKAAQVNYEDEPYTYLAFARPAATIPPRGRIVSRVRVSKARCVSAFAEDGHLAEETMPRRDRVAYARMRRAAWGDALLRESQRK